MKKIALFITILVVITFSPLMKVQAGISDFTVEYTLTPPDVSDGLKGEDWDQFYIDTFTINKTEGSATLDSTNVSLYSCHNETYLFIALEYNDPAQDNSDLISFYMDINKDLSFNWDTDYFDSIIGQYYGSYYKHDGYIYNGGDSDLHSYDTYDDGVDNVIGSGSYSDGRYFYEFAQEMNSTDDIHDISLEPGDQLHYNILVMDFSSGPSNPSYYTGPPKIVTIGKEQISPVITVSNPMNTTYTTTDVWLNYTVNEEVDWIGYALDQQSNKSISGNTLLTNLSEGSHSIVVYAEDSAGNLGSSDRINFSVNIPQTTEITTLPMDNTTTSSVIITSSTTEENQTSLSTQVVSSTTSISITSPEDSTTTINGFLWVTITAVMVIAAYRKKN